MLIASIHALKHLGHRVALARIFHVAEGGDPRLDPICLSAVEQ